MTEPVKDITPARAVSANAWDQVDAAKDRLRLDALKCPRVPNVPPGVIGETDWTAPIIAAWSEIQGAVTRGEVAEALGFSREQYTASEIELAARWYLKNATDKPGFRTVKTFAKQLAPCVKASRPYTSPGQQSVKAAPANRPEVHRPDPEPPGAPTEGWRAGKSALRGGPPSSLASILDAEVPGLKAAP